jgi:aminotransferase
MRYCGIGKSGFDAAMTHKDIKNRWWEYQISEPFIKMLPTNIAAAIGIAQLNKIEQLQERRKQIWDIYQDEFSNINSLIKPIDAPSHTRHSYFTYCIRAKNRDDLANHLLENGIYTTLRYHPLHLNKIYNQENIELKNSEILNKDALSLPLHPRLTDMDVEKIITEVKRFYAKKSLC